VNDPFSTSDTATTPNTTEVVVTLKGGNGYDQPWVVLHAPDVASANALLSDDAAATQDLLDNTRKAANYFTGSSTAPAAAASAPTPPQQSAPGGEARSCKHGAMKYQTGVAKSGPNVGSVWKRFVCPTPQGTADQCKAQYIND